MKPKLRRAEIMARVNEGQTVTVENLSAEMGVSKETIRRDLTQLAATGQLRKYHGGAKALLAPAIAMDEVESPFQSRISQNAEAKQRIAKATAALFHAGDTVFIDTGTTTLFVADALAEVSHLTVITNGPEIASRIAANRSNKVFLIGGAYAPEVGENLGPLALAQIAEFHAEHAILTVGAIDADGITDFDLQEAEIARAMVDRARTLTVVADHTKFGRRAVFSVASLDRINRIVTDSAPEAALADALKTHSALLILPSDELAVEPEGG